jgi:hypothetical protein
MDARGLDAMAMQKSPRESDPLFGDEATFLMLV